MAAQTGCYVSGVDILPEGGRYLWSATLAEPSLNLAVGGAALAQVRAAGAGKGAHAGASGDRWRRSACHRTRLCRRLSDRLDDAASDGRDAELADGAAITVSSRPSEDFFRVARTLYDDPAIRAAAEAYVGVLAGAETPVQVSEAHLVLTDGGAPVAAASLYQVGALAGLYNVGTRASTRSADSAAPSPARPWHMPRATALTRCFCNALATGRWNGFMPALDSPW